MKILFGAFAAVLLFLAAVQEARATVITLNDLETLQNFEYADPMEAAAGHSYRFSFSYWIDTNLAPGQGGGAQNHDTFYYAFLAATSADDFAVLFERNPVDILAGIPQDNPLHVPAFYFSPAHDLLLSPYFLVGDKNSDFYANVHIDYQLQEVQRMPVPEPSSLLLVGAGLLALYGGYRRRK